MTHDVLKRAPRIGSLCSGYGGLDMAVQQVFGGDVAWFFEFDKAPSKVLAHHWPDVPNYGDMTKGDWAGIEQVDILCGGTPCQDLSGAGRRKGMTEGTRSNLWVQMREAIAIQRPALVVWENVRGAFSAKADSEVEREEGLLGVGPDGLALRALGRVLGDLSSLGYDTEWVGVRASDAGAPHARFRVFVLAYPAGNPWRFDNGNHVPVWGGAGHLGTDSGPDGFTHADGSTICDPGGQRRDEGHEQTGRRDEGVDWSSLANEPATDGPGIIWGEWESAVRQWERVTGHKAPPPTVPTGRDGRERANPAFGEWMMGLPAGHVTNPDIGISWQEQWSAIGNGVVPAQGAHALRLLTGRREGAVV